MKLQTLKMYAVILAISGYQEIDPDFDNGFNAGERYRTNHFKKD